MRPGPRVRSGYIGSARMRIFPTRSIFRHEYLRDCILTLTQSALFLEDKTKHRDYAEAKEIRKQYSKYRDRSIVLRMSVLKRIDRTNFVKKFRIQEIYIGFR